MTYSLRVESIGAARLVSREYARDPDVPRSAVQENL